VPVGGFVEHPRAASVQAVGHPCTAGEPVRSGRDYVLIPVARHRDNDHIADHGAEEKDRDRGYDVRPDQAGRRFLAAPARAAAEQPRGLPRLGGTDAIPGKSLGKTWVEVMFIVSSRSAGLRASWLECFAPAVADWAPVAGALGPAPQ
jgi:hypothetical protein